MNSEVTLKRTLSKEEKNLLNTLQPTSRKLMIIKFAKRPFHKIPTRIAQFNRLEIELQKQWKEQALADMNFYKFRSDPLQEAYCLQRGFSEGCCSTAQLLGEAMRSHSRGNNKNVFRFISLLKKYLAQMSDFNRYACEMFLGGATISDIKAAALEKQKQNRRDNEDRLFTKQVIKHIKALKQDGQPIELDLLKFALNARFSDDIKIMEDQVTIVRDTYGAYADPDYAARVMHFCFRFIAESFKVAPCPNPLLIDYLLLEDRISDVTYDLWADVFPAINQACMNVLVYLKVKTLADQIDRNKPVLNSSERNIIGVMEMYDPDRRNKQEKTPASA